MKRKETNREKGEMEKGRNDKTDGNRRNDSVEGKGKESRESTGRKPFSQHPKSAIVSNTYTLHVHGSANSNDATASCYHSTTDVTPADVIRQTGK